MSTDDLRHRASPVAGGSTGDGLGERDTAAGPAAPELDAMAARVPPEYRDAYLDGVARARAVREDTAA